MWINTYRDIFTDIWHVIINTSIEAYKVLSMAKQTRGQGSHLGNETKTSVPALILVEGLGFVLKHTNLFRPQILNYG